MISRTSKHGPDRGAHTGRTRPRSPRCPPARDEAAVLAHLLGHRAVVVGEVEGIALAMRADDVPTHADAASAAPGSLLTSVTDRSSEPIDAQALWVLRHGLVHVLGRDAAALHASRTARQRARRRVDTRLSELRLALQEVLALANTLGPSIDTRSSDILDRAEQLLGLIDRADATGDRLVVSPASARDSTDSRRRQIWNTLAPERRHDLPRVVFAAACHAAGLRWPYEAAMVAALEAGNPRAMWFGSGSRLLEHRWRTHALDYWRKAYGALDRLEKSHANSGVLGED